MKPFLRAVGWLLLLAGLTMGGLAILASRGVSPFGIQVFDQSAGTAMTMRQRMVGWLLAAAVGAILLRLTRRDWTKASR